jgi:hypothetical protein
MSKTTKTGRPPVQLSERTFYKTKSTYEVLSEKPLGDVSLKELDELCDSGPCSGRFFRRQERNLNGRQAARALEAQGSNPSFFNLTEKGEDANE